MDYAETKAAFLELDRRSSRSASWIVLSAVVYAAVAWGRYDHTLLLLLMATLAFHELAD